MSFCHSYPISFSTFSKITKKNKKQKQNNVHQLPSSTFLFLFLIATLSLIFSRFLLALSPPLLSSLISSLQQISFCVWCLRMERIIGEKYKLGRKIGSGSFGEIFLGTTFSLISPIIYPNYLLYDWLIFVFYQLLTFTLVRSLLSKL